MRKGGTEMSFVNRQSGAADQSGGGSKSGGASQSRYDEGKDDAFSVPYAATASVSFASAYSDPTARQAEPVGHIFNAGDITDEDRVIETLRGYDGVESITDLTIAYAGEFSDDALNQIARLIRDRFVKLQRFSFFFHNSVSSAQILSVIFNLPASVRVVNFGYNFDQSIAQDTSTENDGSRLPLDWLLNFITSHGHLDYFRLVVPTGGHLVVSSSLMQSLHRVCSHANATKEIDEISAQEFYQNEQKQDSNFNWITHARELLDIVAAGAPGVSSLMQMVETNSVGLARIGSALNYQHMLYIQQKLINFLTNYQVSIKFNLKNINERIDDSLRKSEAERDDNDKFLVLVNQLKKYSSKVVFLGIVRHLLEQVDKKIIPRKRYSKLLEELDRLPQEDDKIELTKNGGESNLTDYTSTHRSELTGGLLHLPITGLVLGNAGQPICYSQSRTFLRRLASFYDDTSNDLITPVTISTAVFTQSNITDLCNNLLTPKRLFTDLTLIVFPDSDCDPVVVCSQLLRAIADNRNSHDLQRLTLRVAGASLSFVNLSFLLIKCTNLNRFAFSHEAAHIASAQASTVVFEKRELNGLRNHLAAAAQSRGVVDEEALKVINRSSRDKTPFDLLKIAFFDCSDIGDPSLAKLAQIGCINFTHYANNRASEEEKQSSLMVARLIAFTCAPNIRAKLSGIVNNYMVLLAKTTLKDLNNKQKFTSALNYFNRRIADADVNFDFLFGQTESLLKAIGVDTAAVDFSIQNSHHPRDLLIAEYRKMRQIRAHRLTSGLSEQIDGDSIRKRTVAEDGFVADVDTSVPDVEDLSMGSEEEETPAPCPCFGGAKVSHASVLGNNNRLNESLLDGRQSGSRGMRR